MRRRFHCASLAAFLVALSAVLPGTGLAANQGESLWTDGTSPGAMHLAATVDPTSPTSGLLMLSSASAPPPPIEAVLLLLNNPADDQALFDQAQALFDQGKFEEAAAIWKPIADASSTDIARQAAFGYAKALLKLGKDFQKAKEAYLAVTARWPEAETASSGVLFAGYCALKLTKADAKVLFTRTVSDYPGTADAAHAKLRLAYLALLDKDHSAAEDWFWEAARDPEQSMDRRITAYTQYGHVAISRYFAAARADDPDAARFLRSSRDRLSATVNWLKEQPGYEVNAAFAQVGVAEGYLWEKKLVDAQVAYRSALNDFGALPPAFELLARHGLATALFRLGLKTQSLEQADVIVKLASEGIPPGFSIPVDFLLYDASVLRAALLAGHGQLAEALAAVQPLSARAQQEQFKSPPMCFVGAQAITLEGRILADLGRISEARSAFLKVESLYAHCPDHARFAARRAQELSAAED